MLVVAGVLATPGTAVARPANPHVHDEQWVVDLSPHLGWLQESGARGARTGWNGGLDLRAAYGLEGGDEVGVRLRGLLYRDGGGYAAFAGYRVYAGRQEVKSYLDVELAVAMRPGPAVGLRLGGGFLFELGRGLALSVGVGAYAAYGDGFVSALDVGGALQLRF